MRLAGVIVLYNPDEDELINNIKSYINDLEILIAIDNSDLLYSNNNFSNFLLSSTKIIYTKNEHNLGIAQALNTGAREAIALGYKWLLTMDQDSRASSSMIPKMKEYIIRDDVATIGIISPFHVHGALSSPQTAKNEYVEQTTVMTSGNLLNLAAFLRVGEFKECLFIDYVDHEFCLRLKKHGYKVIMVSSAILIHSLGQFTSHWLANTTNHNFIRRYYITRNRLLVRKLYKKDFPVFCKQDYYNMWKEFVKIFLLEKNKFKKLQAFVLGVYHYKINKFGKLNLND